METPEPRERIHIDLEVTHHQAGRVMVQRRDIPIDPVPPIALDSQRRRFALAEGG